MRRSSQAVENSTSMVEFVPPRSLAQYRDMKTPKHQKILWLHVSRESVTEIRERTSGHKTTEHGSIRLGKPEYIFAPARVGYIGCE